MLVWLVLGIVLVIMTAPVLIEFAVFLGVHALGRRTQDAPGGELQPQRLAILIPAHDEEITIARCIQSLRAADPGRHTFEVIVIADNCSDRTATVAAQAGARVLERNDLTVRGKGAALHFAFGQLEGERWNAYVIVDADTVVETNFVSVLGDCFARGYESVQCIYLVDQPEASQRNRLMNLALLSMNVFRPQSRELLGVSVGIFGNGFGLSSGLLEKLPYTANSITEDLEYHLRMIEAKSRVRFVAQTVVRASFPESAEGQSTQRARWEGGRFLLQRTKGPGMLLKVLQGRFRYVEPFLDLMSLPLAYEVLLLLVTLFLPGFLWYGLVGLGLVVVHLICSVALYGTPGDWKALAGIPGYVFWKVLSLPRILLASRSGTPWVRTKRDR